MSDLTADLLKLAQDEVKLDDDIAVRDADRLKVANDEIRVHADEQAANTAARNVVTTDRALAEATARVQAQERVLAAAQAAGDQEEITLAKRHLRETSVDQSAAQHRSDEAHSTFDQTVKTLRTDTAALHADQDKLAKDEKQVDKDGHEVARDENHVNHDLGLPEGTPIDGAPELDGHGGVIEPPVVVADPIVINDGPIDDWPTHDPRDPGGILVHETVHPEGDPLDPAPAGGDGATTPLTGGDHTPTTLPVLTHDADPGSTQPEHDIDPGHSPDHEVFSHPKDLAGDAHDVATSAGTSEPASTHEPSTHETHETAAPDEHGSAPVSHEDSGHAATSDHDTSDAGHADTVALHH